MARRIRSKEAQVLFVVDGVRLGQSMRKVRNFSITPDAEITKTMFVGERRANGDLDIRGYDFSFEVHLLNRDWFDLWEDIQNAEEQGNELPEIAVLVNFAYRGNPSHAIAIQDDVILKLDTFDNPDGDFAGATWSGFGQTVNGL